MTKKISLNDWIDTELPQDGEWYRIDGSEQFKNHATLLLSFGLLEDQIKDILSNLYATVAEEFGY